MILQIAPDESDVQCYYKRNFPTYFDKVSFANLGMNNLGAHLSEMALESTRENQKSNENTET